MKKKLAALLLTLVMALTATIAVYATRPTGGGDGVVRLLSGENVQSIGFAKDSEGTIIDFNSAEEFNAYFADMLERNGSVLLDETTTVDKDGNVTTSKLYGPEGH